MGERRGTGSRQLDTQHGGSAYCEEVEESGERVERKDIYCSPKYSTRRIFYLYN